MSRPHLLRATRKMAKFRKCRSTRIEGERYMVTKSPDEVAPLDFEQKIVVIFWEYNVLKLSKIIFFDALFL